MLPDEIEAENNRKIILAISRKIDILEKNVKDLQSQLQEAYKTIARLKENECSCSLLDDVHATEEY